MFFLSVFSVCFLVIFYEAGEVHNVLAVSATIVVSNEGPSSREELVSTPQSIRGQSEGTAWLFVCLS